MLHIQVADPEVFAYYEAPANSEVLPTWRSDYVGQHGCVFPGGSFCGWSYEDLRDLGSGCHDIPLRPASPRLPGVFSGFNSNDERSLFRIRYQLFLESVGCAREYDTFGALLCLLSPTIVHRVIDLLPQHHVNILRRVAAGFEVPKPREPESLTIYGSETIVISEQCRQALMEGFPDAR
jgi:hypothetical protein